MTHVQAMYFLDSMVTKLHFEIMSIDHVDGYDLTIVPEVTLQYV